MSCGTAGHWRCHWKKSLAFNSGAREIMENSALDPHPQSSPASAPKLSGIQPSQAGSLIGAGPRSLSYLGIPRTPPQESNHHSLFHHISEQNIQNNTGQLRPRPLIRNFLAQGNRKQAGQKWKTPGLLLYTGILNSRMWSPANSPFLRSRLSKRLTYASHLPASARYNTKTLYNISRAGGDSSCICSTLDPVHFCLALHGRIRALLSLKLSPQNRILTQPFCER